ncbi:MAG: phospholipase D family protein, partial [Bdellovibrio sp.]|nr:phospholipase D family protein [Bdellovibrio sp.]
LWSIGPVVRDLSIEFDTYWNSETSYPIASVTQGLKVTQEDLYELRAKLRLENLKAIDSVYVKTLKDTQLVRRFSQGELPLYWCPSKVYSDPPEKLMHKIHDESQNLNFQLRPYVESAKKEILMVTPYFVPGPNGVEYFRQKVKSGISVIVITNSLASGDVATVFSGYKKYRKDLIKAGVHLYELRPNVDKEMRKTKTMGSSGGSHAGLHGKVMVFDNSTMFVGSMNLDPRSFNLNSEMGVVMKCPDLANAFSGKFKHNLAEIAYKVDLDDKGELVWTTYDEGKKTTLHGEPETSWWQRTKASFMSIFVPESKL